jgi:hypothetical protein
MSKNRDLANNYNNSVVDAKLNKADNLNDLPNKATARTNLGLSTGATSTVTTSSTDTTAGRLLKVGDFGTLQKTIISNLAPFGTDFNSYTQPGFYFANGSVWLNPPPGTTAGILTVKMYDARVMQEFFTLSGNKYIRTFLTSWTSWQELYHTGNILGTVSATGTFPNLVPTGAIMESGSNANGEYVKFANGTMICTRATTFDFSIASRKDYYFPANFITQPYAFVSYQATSVVSRYVAYESTFVMPQFLVNPVWAVVNQNTVAETLEIYLCAIGRWK